LQTAYNMVSPLIPRFVISQVVREMTVLELAPTIMAIIYAGKIGSSMAGGIGTMRITEQIDALEVMGINSSSYLVLPKIIASLLMYPLLVVLSGVCAIIGGYLVGTLSTSSPLLNMFRACVSDSMTLRIIIALTNQSFLLS